MHILDRNKLPTLPREKPIQGASPNSYEKSNSFTEISLYGL